MGQIKIKKEDTSKGRKSKAIEDVSDKPTFDALPTPDKIEALRLAIAALTQ